MAEAHQTGQDHSTVRTEETIARRLKERWAIDGALKSLGLQLPAESALAALDEALQRFESNALRFGMGPTSEKVLKQHLAFTILVPGGKASRARKAVDILGQNDFFNLSHVTIDVATVIRPYVRFHNQKALHLNIAIEQWNMVDGINHLALSTTVQGFRDSILERKYGLGKKAVAHFMRNVGLSKGANALPIIDVHIHKALEAWNFKHDTYESAETSFTKLSRLLDVRVHMLDACLWCAYANNWDFSQADFDNFGVTASTTK